MVFKSCKVVDDKEDAVLSVFKVVSLDTQTAAELLRTESVFLSELSNKHIIEQFDSFETDNLFCIVIEYCQEGDLANYE